ncbi:MAG: 7-cyano-7-deazaguanine synthase [Cenarchaeum symbiont of Oopsacas minuta]|nr:7-cyano-7-deazaguanine synthase [Cenarchaeum symbiont of Oopsacas minuta]
MKKKAVLVYSGGADSVCAAVMLSNKYDLYGITFVYGQRAKHEIIAAKKLAKHLKIKEHKIVDISFMKDLYGDNVLTDSSKDIPDKFEYSIVVPIRNAIFLSVASAWAYTLGAQLVGYGAHVGDVNYPDCRPTFAKKLADAFNLGEKDGIKSGLHKEIKIWSPYSDSLSKSDLLRFGHDKLGDTLFDTWSCYMNKKYQCGRCESCNNRKAAFMRANISDKTVYLA